MAGVVQLTTLLRRAGVWSGDLGGGPPVRRDGSATTPSGPEGLQADAARRLRELGRPRAVVDAWLGADLSADAVARVADPLGRRRATARPGAPWPVLLGPEASRAVQVDPTTCGGAVLALLAADGDPGIAAWLERGRPAGSTSAAGRFGALQRALQGRATRAALLGAPWPRALGTPPWGAVRVARWGRVRFGHRVVDDTDTGDLVRVRAGVEAALARGIPVPLYVGGDTGRGLAAAVPRHVVLLLPTADASGGAHHVYEPGSGSVHVVARELLWSGAGPLEALGRWTHVAWVLLPA